MASSLVGNRRRWLAAAECHEARRGPSKLGKRKAGIARDLQEFLRSADGGAALTLLAATRGRIVLVESGGPLVGSVYILNGRGLRESFFVILPSGGRYETMEGYPKESAVSAEDVVRAALQEGMDPSTLLGEIIEGIDGLAHDILVTRKS